MCRGYGGCSVLLLITLNHATQCNISFGCLVVYGRQQALCYAQSRFQTTFFASNLGTRLCYAHVHLRPCAMFTASCSETSQVAYLVTSRYVALKVNFYWLTVSFTLARFKFVERFPFNTFINSCTCVCHVHGSCQLSKLLRKCMIKLLIVIASSCIEGILNGTLCKMCFQECTLAL